MNHGGEIALREKDFDSGNSSAGGDYQARVHDFALGMVELGLWARRRYRHHRRQPAGLGCRPRSRSHAIGAMSLGLYRDVLDEEAAYS